MTSARTTCCIVLLAVVLAPGTALRAGSGTRRRLVARQQAHAAVQAAAAARSRNAAVMRAGRVGDSRRVAAARPATAPLHVRARGGQLILPAAGVQRVRLRAGCRQVPVGVNAALAAAVKRITALARGAAAPGSDPRPPDPSADPYHNPPTVQAPA